MKSELKVPLIVGGGIRNIQQLNHAYNAGADLVVIGTAFENDPSFFNELNHTTHEHIRGVDTHATSK